jgi:hypothetical protein
VAKEVLGLTVSNHSDDLARNCTQRLRPNLSDYQRYQDVYASCPARLNISGCDAAHEDTTVEVAWGNSMTLPSPMPGIVPYPNATNPRTKSSFPYTHWLCGYFVISVDDMIQFADLPDQSSVYSTFAVQTPRAAVGYCQSGKDYAWGFSFLFTLCTLVLQIFFTLLMYAIDISAARRAPPISRQEARGEFKDAVTLVTQAQAQFGAEVAEWTAEGLRKRLYGGKVGMSFTNVTKRPNDREQLDDHFSEERQRLGDEYGADWGGEVLVRSV